MKNQLKKHSKKIFYATAFILLLIFVLHTVSSPATEIFEHPASEASYIFWKEGSTYYRKDGTSGGVSSGTNATTLIQQAVDAAPNGELHFKNGTFTFTLVTPKQNRFTGEGKTTTVLDGNIVNSGYYNAWSFEHLTLKKTDGSAVVEIRHGSDIRFEDVRFEAASNTSGTCVEIDGATYGSTQRLRFTECEFFYAEYCIWTNSTVAGYVNDIWFTACRFGSEITHGIYENGADNHAWYIGGCSFFDWNGTALRIRGGGNHIYDNHFDSGSESYTWLDLDGDTNKVHMNSANRNFAETITGNSNSVYGNYQYPNAYSEATYVVFKDGSYTCMQDSDSGTVTARSTNSSQIFNWAIGNTTNGKIFAKAGTYPCHGLDFTDKEYVTLQGEGSSTVLQLDADANLIIVDNSLNVEIRDLKLDGNYPTRTSGHGIYNDISSNLASELHVENVIIRKMPENGLHLVGSGLRNPWVGTEIKDNIILDCYKKAIYTCGDDFTIKGNYLGVGTIATNDDIVTIDGGSYNLFEGNTVFGSDVGYDLVIGGDRNVIQDNLFDYANKSGILLYNAHNNTVNDNRITRPNQGGHAGAEGSGIYIAGNSSDNEITNNRILDTPTYAIYEGGTADYNIIKGNIVTDYTTAAISFVGSHTIIFDNEGYLSWLDYDRGTSFPASPSQGQQFYIYSNATYSEGLYTFDGSQWNLAEGDCPASVYSTYTFPNGTSEQTIFEISLSGEPIKLYNTFFDFGNLTQDATLKVYSKINATGYQELIKLRLTIGSTERSGIVMKQLVVNTALKFTLTSSIAEEADRVITYRYFKEEY